MCEIVLRDPLAQNPPQERARFRFHREEGPRGKRPLQLGDQRIRRFVGKLFDAVIERRLATVLVPLGIQSPLRHCENIAFRVRVRRVPTVHCPDQLFESVRAGFLCLINGGAQASQVSKQLRSRLLKETSD